MRPVIGRLDPFACAVAIAILACASPAAAQFDVIHAFIPTTPPAPQEALYPNELVLGADGNFYGTSQMGGEHAAGTVFRMTPAGAVTILYSFTGVDDARPVNGLVQARDGNFYGTTTSAGSNQGAVFRVTPAGAFTMIHGFSGADGSEPRARLVEAFDGNLYGTTQSGGDHAAGVAFRITPAGGFAVIHSFDGPIEGAFPHGALVQGFDGNLYGTTAGGGATNSGTVFTMTLAGTVSAIHQFAGAPADGGSGITGLVQAIDGNFYGTTILGGAMDLGTVFRITPAGTLTLLHSFTGGPGEGWYPSAPLIMSSDLRLYGTTQNGPMSPGFNGWGTIFSIGIDGGSFATLHQFNGVDGANPLSPLVQGTDGNFYGTINQGGASSFGEAYRFGNAATCEDSLRLSFSGGTLTLGFTLETAAPATWAAWIFTPEGNGQLFSLSIPAVTPAVSFSAPISPFPNIGNVFVLTVLSGPGFACADLQAVNTSS